MILVLQHIFASRETILGMEHHDQERRAADPDTWHLQKHLIVDFIQKVDIMKCIIIFLNNHAGMRPGWSLHGDPHPGGDRPPPDQHHQPAAGGGRGGGGPLPGLRHG